MKKFVIIPVIVIVLVTGMFFIFRVLEKSQVKDKGGMEQPIDSAFPDSDVIPEKKDLATEHVVENKGETSVSTPIRFFVQSHPMILATVNNLVLMDSNYCTITLSEEDADRYPKLQEALTAKQQKQRERVVADLQDNGAIVMDLSERRNFAQGTSALHYTFARADEFVFSYSVENEVSIGSDIRGSVSYLSVNLDPMTGEDISLSEVIVNQDDFANIICEELIQQNREKLEEYYDASPQAKTDLLNMLALWLDESAAGPAWEIGYNALTLRFDSYALGGYLLGSPSVSINYSTYPEYFAPKYRGWEDNSVQIPDMEKQRILLNDRKSETIWFEEEREGFGIARIFDEGSDNNLFWITIQECLWVTGDDTELISEYGLPKDLDGYDYEVVPKHEEEKVYIVLKDGSTSFALLDEENQVFDVETDWKTFVDYLLLHLDSGIYVNYRTTYNGEIVEISEQYIP